MLSALTGLIICIQPVFAVVQNENIITYINLNEKAFYDVEIVLTKDEKILLPFKQLSEIFEVKTKLNHSTKEIEFETNEGKKGIVGFNYIIFDNKKISTNKNYYQKQGLMEEIKDEIYCDAKDLNIIFGAELKTDKNDLSVSANTKRDLILLRGIEYNETEDNTKK